ncbi:MAG TPA: tetratricopeptide repeat protein [Vicinamibacterales bacterium]|jgi:tetratricopeptide (TPR) repeat protein
MRILRLFAVFLLIGTVAAQPADPLELVKQARKLNSEGKQDAAIAMYQEALQRSPDLFDAHYGLGIALDLAGRFADARQHFAKAIAIAPEEGKNQAITAMAVSYAFAGDAKGSSTFYRQLYDRQMASDTYGGAAETANALGRVYLESGDLDNALKWYQTGYETVRRQRDLPGPLVDLSEMRWAHARARIAARKGDAEHARAEMATAKAILDKGTNPDENIQYPYLAGYVNLFLGSYAAAVSELQQANQQDPFVLVLLAQAYEKSGDAAKAHDTYEKVIASNAHNVNNAFARAMARKKI